MTSLRPAYSFTAGGQRWTEQVLAIDLELAPAPMVDVATVLLPAAATPSAGVGDDMLLTLDGGEGSADVFAGTVDAIRHELDRVRISAVDGGGKLARSRPAVTYEQATVGTVVRNLCSDAGVEVDEVETGPVLAFYAADPGRSALHHVARLAGWVGALARFTADGRLNATVPNATTPDLALRYGREITTLAQVATSSAVDAVVVAGESGVGDASDPSALRATTDFFGGNRPDGPGPGTLWLFEPALRTSGAARTAGAAVERMYRSGEHRTVLRTFLVPALRPGSVVEIQDLPDGLAGGPFWVERVRHRLSPRGAVTEARLRQGGDSFDPSSLLGSLAGALAGAL